MADPWDQFADAPPASRALEQLRSLGVQPTSGFRTSGDVARLKAQGYTPAANGAHNVGDGVDLVPGKSGLSLAQLQARAAREFGPDAKVEIHNGSHVHVAVPGWGLAPDLYRSNAWDEFKDAAPSKAAKAPTLGDLAPKPAAPANLAALGNPTGQVHDGDTFKLSTGPNARLFGVDAFELGQTGRTASGGLVNLGQLARGALQPFATPGGQVSPTGGFTYGRPVVTLNKGGDAGQSIIRQGLGMAEPDFLRGSPQFGPYMEAERLARLNRLNGFQTNAETPSQFRHRDGPWASATPGVYGQGADVTFFDTPTPFQGLRPEIAKGYLAIWDNPKSKPEDLLAYAKENGFTIDPEKTRKAYEKRAEPGAVLNNSISYEDPPHPLIDPGDGRFGTTMRGVADPINVLDEMGGVVDAVGGTKGRENVWNSDRRFGDILANNVGQNRDIIAHDEATHPYFRLGGQLASGLAVPGASVEGLGARALAGALEKGASEFAANQVAKRAVATRLGAVGAIEGGAAGAGAGETPQERVAGAIVGAPLGGTVGLVAPPLLGLAGRGIKRGARKLGDLMGQGASEVVPSEAASVSLPSVVAMAAERGPELVGPAAPRPRDYIKLGPDPFAEFQDAPFGVTRPVNERLNSDEIAALATGVDPAGAVPRPATSIQTLDEAMKANPGRFLDAEAPNEFDALGVRTVTTRTGGKVKVRGPFDITQSLRLMGGVKDEGGDLAHLGITNEPRRMDFGSNEQFLGKLIDNERGMSLDDAAMALWEEGYFPDFRERPTPDDLLDRLRTENTGAQRYFHPDDLNELSDFHAAQAERGRFEEADASGSPLTEERGVSVNLDDLAANTPPTSAYEDTPRLTGKVGNINLDRLEKPEDVSALIDQISKRVGGFDAAARGKVTHEETQKLAQDMGLKPEQLLRRQQGQALNAEQLYAARALVQRSRETVARLAKRAVGGSDEDVATFRKAWLAHVALEEQVSGATAEAGRALSQMRMLAKAQDAGADAVRSYLKGIGGKESIEDAANAIVDLMDDPAKAGHFMREAVKPRWRDKFNELWVNSLLSGPRTHVVNFVGNALTTMMSFPELAATAAIGKVTRSQDRALFGEVAARAAGLADSSVDALRAAKAAFKTGEPLDAATKVEAVQHQAIGGRLGQVIRTPTRALTAADEFWKSILSHGELRQIAYRKAFSEAGGSPEAFKSRYAALVANPTEEMLKQAHASARYWTFQKELGPVGRAVQQISNNSVVGKVLLPFVRTPSNIIKFAGERSAFGLLMPEVRQALKAGGRSRDEALAKIALGSGLSTAAVVAALQGRISGSGPTDPRERAALLQSGWQPNSIRIGDRWVSYGRLDPASTLIGVAADFAEAGKWATKDEADKIALNLGLSIAKNITNKTWLSGLSDAFDVLSDPERYGKGYVRKLAASATVPALVAQSAQAIDPNLRDARTIVDAIKARVPILSQSVPVRRNVWGDPVSNGDAIGPDIVSPFYATAISNDPVNVEIARLRAPLAMPQRSITVEGKRVPLDAKQYDEFVQLSGKPAKQYLSEQIRTPQWRAMSDEDRRQLVKEALEDFRASGREALIERHPELGRSTPANDPWAEFKDASPAQPHH